MEKKYYRGDGMNNELLRREEESELDYHKRLVFGKLVDKTLSDEDYAELSRYVYYKEYSSDVCRRMMYGSRFTLELIDELLENKLIESTTDEEYLDKLDLKKAEFYKEKVKLQDQKREFNKILRETARVEHIKDEIHKSVSELSKMKPLNVNYVGRKDCNDREGVLLLSDWHKGLFAKNHWNKFDDDEFNRRVERLTRKTIEYGLSNDICVMNIFLLGDLVNGLIHPTVRITSTEDVIRQTQHVSEVVSEILVELANRFPHVKIHYARGNHDRVTPSKEESLTRESFADIIIWYLQARLQHIDNIEIVENTYDDEIIVADVCGHTIFGVHGHKDRVGNVIQNLTLMIKKFPDFVFLAHTHHLEENEMHGVEVIVNSTLSGVDEYAKDLRLTNRPSQKFMIFDKEEGRLCTYNIKLDIE